MVTEHSLETNGPPIYSKPRPLPPDKFEIARKEFDLLLEIKIFALLTAYGLHPSIWSVRLLELGDHVVITGVLTQ